MTFHPAGTTATVESKRQAFPYFRGLGEDGRRKLLAATQVLNFPQGQALLDEGALCQALLLVERGEIRVYITSPSGREITR